jgi:hypothetical protein
MNNSRQTDVLPELLYSLSNKGGFMSDEAQSGGTEDAGQKRGLERRLVPLEVGSATVYIRQASPTIYVEADDRIYPVSLPSPKEAFDSAIGGVKAFVVAVGEQLDHLAARVQPQELSVEFTLAFEATGTARVIPVLVTTGTKGTAGLRVKAVWRLPDAKNP